ncbi:MAG TPA: SDR family NAD(P)-dependent oxidoreductase [Myxococcales bacterium]|nr:SDR family NAD(P)-dependent oxidoreductase [Myxococcales bacterium]
MKLEGNTVLITGGTSGIGLVTAKELLARGNTVIVTGRDQKKLDAAKQQLPKLTVIQSDAGNEQQVEALHARISKEFPSLNVLMNNAGSMRNVNLHETPASLADLTREIDTNLKGPMWMVSKFLPLLKAQPAAAIVNVSSGLAFVPLPSSPIYCATKAGLNSYTRSLRVQLKNTNVKVFELAPPATETNLFDVKSPDMEGVQVMKVDVLVRHFLKGLERDQLEIRPGQANALKLMNRVAPEFILGQLSKPVDRMLGQGPKN